MESFVYEVPGCVAPDQCRSIIETFEAHPQQQHRGLVGSEMYKPNVKNTVDMNLAKQPEFAQHKATLFQHILEQVQAYMTQLGQEHNIRFSPKTKLYMREMLIHKYVKGVGYFKEHHDFCVDTTVGSYRVFNFLVYLNTVEEGGETEFLRTKVVRPEQGKLVLFPSEWFYFHKAACPRSCDKYVVSGWVMAEVV
jgi:hypothetical protein